MKAKVAVLRVTPDTILSDIDRLVELGGVSPALARGKTTILKDNISWHFPFPAANTTPWQLEGTIQALARRGFTDQVCVQNKTVVTNAFKGEDLNHYVPIFKRYGIPVRYNFRDGDMTWVRYKPKARMRVLDRIFPEGIHVPDYFFGKNIVHLPTTKCHIYTTTTGAMKNAFGGLLNTRRHYTHSWIHETLVDLLAIQKEIHSGLFAIMDGTTAGNGPGPRTMYPVVKNVMLASADQVAIDAVSAKMMGFDPMSIDYIRLAHEDGLGIGRSAGHRDRRRRGCRRGELEVPGRQESRPRSAAAISSGSVRSNGSRSCSSTRRSSTASSSRATCITTSTAGRSSIGASSNAGARGPGGASSFCATRRWGRRESRPSRPSSRRRPLSRRACISRARLQTMPPPI